MSASPCVCTFLCAFLWVCVRNSTCVCVRMCVLNVCTHSCGRIVNILSLIWLLPQWVHLSAPKELLVFSLHLCFRFLFMVSFKFSVKLFAFTWPLIKATLKQSDFDAGERNLWQWALMRQPAGQPARFSLDECCVGLKPDKMGANILEPTNIVIARCSLFHFLYVTVCLCGSHCLSLHLHPYNLREGKASPNSFRALCKSTHPERWFP